MILLSCCNVSLYLDLIVKVCLLHRNDKLRKFQFIIVGDSAFSKSQI
jgi:hypothetical protein